VGARLIAAALDRVADEAPGVCLWVFRDNARARAFYERHGFEPDGLAQELAIGGEAVTEVRYRRLSPGSTTMAR
jgi:ribosomal protein S18 acetylase RimI-like enzyme